MADIIIPWDGEHASIPAGWSRYTALDSKYPKASDSDIAGTGGSATHTHANTTHTHTYASNAHVHATGTIENPTNIIKTDSRHKDAPSVNVSNNVHTHTGGNSGAPTSMSCSSSSFTTGTASNEYSRYHFIFIQGSVSLPLPASSVVMRNDIDSRANASHFDDMNSRYMKGASTSTNAGSGTDVTTHTHTQSHSHTLSHAHSSINSGAGGGNVGGDNIASTSPGNHSHTVSFTAKTETPSNSTAVSAGTGTLAYRELHFWKTSSIASSKKGDIVLSIEGAVPSGWKDLEYNDVYIKGKTEGGTLTTGGAHTHTHSGVSHSHTGTSHTHAFTTTAVGGSNNYYNGGTGSIVGSHTHSGTTGSATNANTGTTSATISTVNDEPTYIKVKYIEKTVDAGGGSFLMMFT